jgi:hypothetical protein
VDIAGHIYTCDDACSLVDLRVISHGRTCLGRHLDTPNTNRTSAMIGLCKFIRTSFSASGRSSIIDSVGSCRIFDLRVNSHGRTRVGRHLDTNRTPAMIGLSKSIGTSFSASGRSSIIGSVGSWPSRHVFNVQVDR